MSSKRNRIISTVLTFVVVLSTLFGVLPPIKISAADGGEGGLKISSPADGAEVNGFETIKIKWNKVSGADHYVLVVKDEATGKKIYEDELGSSTRTVNIYYDDYVFTEDGHEYKIYVAARNSSNVVLNNGSAWNAIYVDNYLELETPEIVSHSYLDTHCVDDALYVSWDPIDGADDYSVAVKKLKNDAPDYGNNNEPGTSVTYSWTDDCEIKVSTSNLVAGKWYKIALCAENTDQDISSNWTSVYILMEESSYLNVSSCDDLDSAKNSTGVFWIESNLDWDIDCDVSWLTWSINQVDDTHAKVTVKATSANTGTRDREAEITISAPGVDDEYVYVCQLAPEATEPEFFDVTVSDKVTVGENIQISGTIESYPYDISVVSIEVANPAGTLGYYPFRKTSINSDSFDLTSITTKSSDGTTTYGGIKTGVVASGYVGTSYQYYSEAFDFTEPGTYKIAIRAQNEAGLIGESIHYVEVSENPGTGILGDVNSDGKVTDMDRFILNKYLVGAAGYPASRVNSFASDIDNDGKITADDATILARHLADWTGYEDLNAFHKEVESNPVVDTSKWTMNYSANTLNIVVSLASGQPDTSKNYLFVAEDYRGLHYSGIIPAGNTSATFSIKGMQMPRGQKYTYYVVPEGVALAVAGKDNYYIGKSTVPLYGGNMITSVTMNGSSINNGDTVYSGNDIVVKWDGSYGVENFFLTVTSNGKNIISQTYSHSGPGSVTIPNNTIDIGELVITGSVTAPSGSGISNAVSTWKCFIVAPPVDEKEYRTEFMTNLVKTWYTSTRSFERYDDLAKDEISIGLFDLVFADITDLGGVVEKVVGGSADVTNAKHTLIRLIDAMDDEIYGAASTECADVIVSLYEWIQETPYDDIRDVFSGVSGEAGVISTIADIKQMKIDTINNSLSQYIEYLFDIGMDESAVMEKYAEILTMQNKNLNKKNALNKVQKATGSFSKATKGVLEALDKVSTVGDIMAILYDSGIKDYSAQLIKLSVLEDALREYNYPHLSSAAESLKNEMENRMQKLATESLKYGLEYAVSKASGLWGIVSAGVSLTVGQDAMAKRDACYILEIEDALYYHTMSLKSEYTATGDADVLDSIRQELHAIADCRAMLNDLGMELNSWGIFVTDKDKYDYFSIYKHWYCNQHDDIDEFFK